MSGVPSYEDFLNAVIEGGIEGAKRDYALSSQRPIREGSIAGFEACRGKNPSEIAALLKEAREKAHRALHTAHILRIGETEDRYWWARGFELEVEWVANVVSAALWNAGLPVIVPPTARGVMRAAEILGVKGESDGERGR